MSGLYGNNLIEEISILKLQIKDLQHGQEVFVCFFS